MNAGVISDATKSAVVNVDYRLAPEHKWPAQLEDSVKLYRWVSFSEVHLGECMAKICGHRLVPTQHPSRVMQTRCTQLVAPQAVLSLYKWPFK